MKRLFAMVLAFMMVGGVCCAESSLTAKKPGRTNIVVIGKQDENTQEKGSEINLDELSYAELLDLQKEIASEILSRPEWSSTNLTEGDYEIGVDIPSGMYSISTWSRTTFIVFDESGKQIMEKTVINGYPLERLKLFDGWTLRVDHAAYLAPPYPVQF